MLQNAGVATTNGAGGRLSNNALIPQVGGVWLLTVGLHDMLNGGGGGSNVGVAGLLNGLSANPLIGGGLGDFSGGRGGLLMLYYVYVRIIICICC